MCSLLDRINKQLQQLKMLNKQSQYSGDNFGKMISQKLTPDDLDPKRIKRIEMAHQNYNIKDIKNDDDSLIKPPVKFHKFRQDARKHHREIIQQTHDFMKMTQNITKSVLDNDRFKFLVGDKNKKNKDISNLDVNNRDKREIPNVILNFNVQLNSSIIEGKVDVKKLYQIYPYKKMSIQIEPNNYLNPAFQFFFFRSDTSKSLQLQNSLIQIVDDGLISDTKQQISSLTYYLDYFDYIHFITFLYSKPPNIKDQPYSNKFPKQLVQMGRNTHRMQENSDEQDFNKDQIVIDAMNSFHRIFQCDQTQLSRPYDSIYFPDLKDFENYKKLREIQYKNLKIEASDIVINTDVRNIISSQKIYLINIIEQMELSIELMKANKQEYLMKDLFESMKRKIYEYLHLVCWYTKSTILIRYNIADPYLKIYQFLKKSIMYGKPYEKLDPKVLQKYPVLEIWYRIPQKIYGYDREEIHKALYRLIEATIQFEKKIKYMEQYQNLKAKQYDRKYLQESK